MGGRGQYGVVQGKEFSVGSHPAQSGPIVPVCAAIIVREGRVLVGRRREGRTDTGKWEFPGGKLLPGEDPRECLVRELDEEFGVRAKVGGVCEVVNHTYGRYNVLLIFYRADIPDGSLASRDHDMILWAGPEELSVIDFLDADRPIAKRLIEELRNGVHGISGGKE